MVYCTKESIMDIIAEQNVEIQELKDALTGERRSVVIEALERQLEFLEDNVYRYRLQAKAWGLI